MFSSFESEIVGFDSNWDSEKSINENESQTSEYFTSEKGTSVNTSRSIAVQADSIPNDENSHDKYSSTPPGLSGWLQSVIPDVLNQLETIESSSCFNRYDPYFGSENQEIKAHIVQKIDAQDVSSGVENITSQGKNASGSLKNKHMPIMDLSWSSAGTSLAATASHLYHDSWCQHNAYVGIYGKRGREDELKLIHSIKVTSCVSTVIFHPSEPALLATGAYSGEISIWNLQYLQDGTNRDILLSSNSVSHSGKAITSLVWLNSEQIHRYIIKMSNNKSEKILASAGSDGKVIIWSVDTAANLLAINISYEVKTITAGKIKQSPDISHMDFCKVWDNPKTNNECIGVREYADDYFVIGCRTGEVLLCRTSKSKALIGSQSLNPCVANMDPHNAAILSLKFCLKRARYFLTLGADQEIRIYDVLHNSPIQIIYLEEDFSSANWVPDSDSLLILAASEVSRKSENSLLQIFSIITKNKVRINGLVEQEDLSGLTCVELNGKITNKLACGDVFGKIKIWNIPFKYMLPMESL